MNKDELLRKTIEDLGKCYPKGLYEYLFKFRSDSFRELQQIEDAIDKAYLYGSVKNCKAALREYWVFHVKTIQIYKNRSNVDSNLTKARKEMLQERMRA